MSVNVKIEAQGLFKKRLSVQDIVTLKHLAYGISDENYRLIPDKIAEHTLVYDTKILARGIEVSFDHDSVLLRLCLPTSLSEINLFYQLIKDICKELKTKSFMRDEEKCNIQDIEKLIVCDKETSILALEELKSNIGKNEYSRLEIFGVMNPISIGKNEIDFIDSSMEKFEEFLHEKQNLDVYYATPRVYKKEEKMFGIYVIGANIPSVVPNKPYIVLNQIEGIKEWYVMLKDNHIVKYDDFINAITKSQYYDANHMIICLSENEIDDIISQFQTEV
ncbi:MAG: DUF4299 family protein [Clostridia bacterium]|nr:DUF4299 family protein [Clostridia bacterium]